MFNSEVLEVGIGMAFLFLLMSLICTGVKEWLEGIFKWRAKDLERGLRTLLDDNEGRLTAHLYAHPLVSSLYQGTYDPTKLISASTAGRLIGVGTAREMPLSARRNLPSYIPSGHFAKALIDLVGRGPASVDAQNTPDAPLSVAMLRERAAALDSAFLRRAVLTAIDHSEGDLNKLGANLQSWFDGSMDRASGWYKRRTQTVLFVLGLGAAAALNVDALYVIGRLTADKAFREAVVSAAAKMEAPASAASGAAGWDAARAARATLNDVGMPMGWRVVDATTGLDKPSGSLGEWTPTQMCRVDAGRPEASPRCEPANYSSARMVAGWLMTAFAVMLGAPFWFDILNKFMVIRSTVKPREKSREEGSEDRADASSKDRPDASGAAHAVPVVVAALQAAPGGGSGAAAGAAPPAPSPASGPPPAFVAHEWRDGVVNPQEIAL